MDSCELKFPSVGGVARSDGVGRTDQKSPRLYSIDAFRGMVIFLMLFVNCIAMNGALPWVGMWFGSAPVSVWRHASSAYDPPTWRSYAPQNSWRSATVFAHEEHGKYKLDIKDADGNDYRITKTSMFVHSPKPLRIGAPVIVRWNSDTPLPHSAHHTENGCTITDLVAPFFVFITGLCIPFARRNYSRPAWLRRVVRRTLVLLALGFFDMSLGAGLSYWWGILQSIALAYLLAAIFDVYIRKEWVWYAVIFAIAVIAILLSLHVPAWTFVGNPALPPFSINYLTDCDFLRPLNAHCTPWAGLAGYGICACLGAMLGNDLRNNRPLRFALVRGGVLIIIGFIIAQTIIPMSKQDVTASYALFTSGLATLVFLAFHRVIDVWNIRRPAAVFTVLGVNAMLAFFLQPIVRTLFDKLGLMQFYYGHSGYAAMAWGLIWVATIWLIVWHCNRRGWYWKA